MSIPEKKVSDTQQKGSKSSTVTFADKVKVALDTMVQNAEGKYEFSEENSKNMSEEVRYAALLEKRQKDTQAAYTKSQQNNKTLINERDLLQSQVALNPKVELTVEEQAKLDDLKITDVDAWYNEKTKLEQEASEKAEKERTDLVSGISQKAEIARRAEVLGQFQASNPELELTNKTIQDNIPPRITKRLESGELTFEEFLEEAKTFLPSSSGKIFTGEKLSDDPNLSNEAGGSQATKEANHGDFNQSYKAEVF